MEEGKLNVTSYFPEYFIYLKPATMNNIVEKNQVLWL